MVKRTDFACRVKRDHYLLHIARNETGELRHRGWKDHDGLPSVGRKTANLVVGIHDGFRMRCALHEESLLDIQRRRE